LSRTALIQITKHPFDRDFRKSLLRAVARSGDVAIHVQCESDRILSVIEPDGVQTHNFRDNSELDRLLKARVSDLNVIVLTGVGGAYAPEVEAAAQIFARRQRYYDVQDDLSYGASGLNYLKFLVRDFRWRRLCGTALVLELGMERFYPGARHLDNASHILSQRKAASPVRAVYIGSIDQRLDLDLLEAIVAQVPVDVLGDFHESARDMKPRLEALAARTGQLRLLGPYNNDDLGPMLEPYSIGLVPYKTPHRLTNHVNPDKIYHYLNAGLGVVSTGIPQAKRLSAHLAILKDASGFGEAAVNAITAQKNWVPEDFLWTARWSQFKSLAAHSSSGPRRADRLTHKTPTRKSVGE